MLKSSPPVQKAEEDLKVAKAAQKVSVPVDHVLKAALVVARSLVMRSNCLACAAAPVSELFRKSMQ